MIYYEKKHMSLAWRNKPRPGTRRVGRLHLCGAYRWPLVCRGSESGNRDYIWRTSIKVWRPMNSEDLWTRVKYLNRNWHLLVGLCIKQRLFRWKLEEWSRGVRVPGSRPFDPLERQREWWAGAPMGGAVPGSLKLCGEEGHLWRIRQRVREAAEFIWRILKGYQLTRPRADCLVSQTKVDRRSLREPQTPPGLLYLEIKT